ncbi:MAG: nuclear transport factor 2 family protein [Pseudomonadota bacterium]
MDLLEELAAERDIRKLLAQYPQLADTVGAAAAWAELFAEDGALVIGPKRIEGRAALRAWMETAQSGPKMRHLMMNPLISVDSPDTATVTMDMALLRGEGEQWLLFASPRYTDRLVRTEGGWKFRERVLENRRP